MTMTKELHELTDEELSNLDLDNLTEVSNTDEVQTLEETSQTQAPDEPEALPTTEQDTPQDGVNDLSVGTKVEEAEESSQEAPEQEAPDYESFYQTLTKPFRANGREIQVQSADDAVRLMQMGANYSKKMEALKPKQALLKTLEKHGLDNPEKLGFLIDLANKNPQAIAKLVADGDVDLYALDTDLVQDYTPNLTLETPNALEEMVNELSVDNPQIGQIIQQASGWDSFSKQVLHDEPQLLRTLAEQQANGLYDQIVNVINYETLMGRMANKPFLQAYSEIESKLLSQQPQSNRFVGTRPNQSSSNQNNHNEQKKRAGVPNQAPTQNHADINFLAISDEELAKLIP